VNFQRANFNNNLVATVSNGKPELLRIIWLTEARLWNAKLRKHPSTSYWKRWN
jgi:hypothetical protein